MTFLLRAGDVEVAIEPEHGGRIGQIVVAGEPLLRGRDEGAGWGWWGSYPLLPWSNRIPDGVFSFEGRTCRVPINWDDGSALHGLTAWVPWRVLPSNDDRHVELAVSATAGCYDVVGRQTFALSDTQLAQRLEVTNAGDAPVPVGLGIHPWFRAGEICVPAERMWPGDGPLPTGPPVPVGADEDLRTPRMPPVMDRCYTGLTESVADVPGVRLHWSDEVTQVVVYSGEPGWVCVEPVTMANDGFRLAEAGVSGTGVVALDPGETFGVSYRFEWT